MGDHFDQANRGEMPGRSTMIRSQQRPHSFPLHYASRPFLGGVLRPFGDLVQADAVLGRLAVGGDYEFRHGAGLGDRRLVAAEFGDCKGDCLIEGVCLHLNRVCYPLRIGEGDAADSHRVDYNTFRFFFT
jgi:hypothetical protein